MANSPPNTTRVITSVQRLRFLMPLPIRVGYRICPMKSVENGEIDQATGPAPDSLYDFQCYGGSRVQTSKDCSKLTKLLKLVWQSSGFIGTTAISTAPANSHADTSTTATSHTQSPAACPS